MKKKMEQVGFLRGMLLLFFAGFLLGLGFLFGFRDSLTGYIHSFYGGICSNLAIYEIEEWQLFLQVAGTELGCFLLLVLFGISILGIPVLVLFPLYKGFIGGALCGSLVIEFSGKGILAGLVYGFPQQLLYIPVLLAVLHKNYIIGLQGLKKKLFLEQLPSIVILAMLLLVGCFTEAYINSWIMKKLLLWIG